MFPMREAQMLLEMSQGISEAHIHLLFDMMLETSQSLLRSQDQRTVLEMGLLKLCLYPQVFDMQKRASQTLSSLKTLSSPPSQRLETKNSMSFKGPKSQSPKPSLSQQRGASSSSSVATSSPALASKVILGPPR